VALILLNMWDMETKTPKKAWLNMPPWLIVGTVAVLLPLFLFMTWKYIHRQKESTTELLLEKGAALIRSFEAGARTGMMGMNWGGVQVQKLLYETAKQPDILYIMVTDTGGKILAHSNPDMIGQIYHTNLSLREAATLDKPEWRRVHTEGGKEVFEVYRRFMPIRSRPLGRRHMMRMMEGDWCRAMFDRGGPDFTGGHIIFVGLDMAPVEIARTQDQRHMVIMALTLLLLGFAGFITLFLAQAYRSTKTSLYRIKAFSDHLVETMPIGMVALDSDGKVRAMNRAAEKMLGRENGQSLGRGAEEILPVELVNVAIKATEKMRAIETELSIELAHAEPLSLEVIAAPLSTEEPPSFSGLVVLFRDLTEIKKLKEEVARNQRLASIGRLAAGVAHEIRNPLSSIKGFATYFRERYKDVPQDQQTAEIMVQEVDRLNRVISQLLEFARPPQIQKRKSNLVELVKESLRMVEQDAQRKSVRISFDLPDQEVLAEVDPDRIKQVLLNLYLNALEAMDEGGTLSVSVSANTGSGTAKIEISDTGRGIAEEDLPHIFDPYFTTKPSGTGLGLAIAHKIIESHGGEILVESKAGAGTTFVIKLPGLQGGRNEF